MNEINITALVENKDLLENLVGRARQEVERAIDDGELLPKDNLMFKQEINNFYYTDKGAEVLGSSSGFYIQKNWKRSGCYSVIERTRNSIEFKKLEHAIGIVEDEEKSELPMAREVTEMFCLLVNFVQTLNNILNPDSEYRSWSNEKIVEYFLSRCKNELIKYTTTAELIGIVFLANKPLQLTIERDIEISLRGINREDLEQDFPASNIYFGQVKPYTIYSLCPYPSVVMTIKMMANERGIARKYVTKCLAVLRLFGVAGVNVVSHVTREDIVLSNHETDNFTPNVEEHLNAFGSYTINNENFYNISTFFEKMYKRLPDTISDSKKIAENPITIAYHRYVDALLSSSVPEQRIANAVMSLEAIFLPKKAAGELKFRLIMYTSKALSALGYEPFKVKDIVAKAYDTRSAFVHGGHLSLKDTKKIETHYTSMKDFIGLLLEYVRASLVLIINLPINKEDFILLIEKAMLDDGKQKELTTLLKDTKDIIFINLSPRRSD